MIWYTEPTMSLLVPCVMSESGAKNALSGTIIPRQGKLTVSEKSEAMTLRAKGYVSIEYNPDMNPLYYVD